MIKKVWKLTITGVLVGALVGLFQLGGQLMIKFMVYLVETDIFTQVIYMMLVVAFSFLARFLVFKNPSVMGSGIPQIELYIRREYEMKPVKTTFAMIGSCFMSFFSGLSLGSEGPSVEIGGCVGIFVDRSFPKEDDLDIVATASACGFACAFLAPIAGVFYIFEEIIHHWNFKHFLQMTYTLLISFFVTLIFNQHCPFVFMLNNYLPIVYFYVLVLLIIFNVVIGKLFTKTLLLVKDFFARFRGIMNYRGVLMFVLAGLISIFYFDLAGSGTELVSVIKEYTVIYVLVILLVVKILLTIFAVNTPCSGGLLIPLLTIGAIIGYLTANLASLWGFDMNYANLIILVSMVMFFAVVTRSKWTAIGLAISFAPWKYVIIPAIICVLGAYYLSKLFKQTDIYEELILRIQNVQDRKQIAAD